MRSTIHLLRGLQCGIRHFQIIGMRVLTAIAIMHQSRARSRSRAQGSHRHLSRSRSSFEDAPFDVTPFADAIVGDATGSLCFATSIAPVGQDFTTYVYGPRGHFVADFTGSSADTLHPKALPQPSGFQMLQEITPVFARLDVYTADGTLIRESPVKEADLLVSSVDPSGGTLILSKQLSSNMRTLDYARPGPSPEANRERQPMEGTSMPRLSPGAVRPSGPRLQGRYQRCTTRLPNCGWETFPRSTPVG